MAIPVVQDLAEMYQECDPAASMNLLARLAVEKSLNSKLDDCRLGLQVGFKGRVHTAGLGFVLSFTCAGCR